MPKLLPFIVIIERRARDVKTWLALLWLLLAFVLALPVQAQPVSERVRAKIAHDMDGELRTDRAPREKWARDVRGVRHVQAIVVSDSTDPEMRELRAQVLRLGGSVHAVHAAMHAITIQIPAQRLNALAQRDDVVSVTPNRKRAAHAQHARIHHRDADARAAAAIRPRRPTAAWTAAASASPCSTRA